MDDLIISVTKVKILQPHGSIIEMADEEATSFIHNQNQEE
jgi:hypothetical protein